ncbi:hypothetical protein DKG75_03140 [Zavarzinia compransoris]|uniref:Uncharacterized protein n=1 Tax=Zavarzinia compransoris TaxID=1264899 RepID=A0A317E8Z9_9PROT|nr:hypothetical protein DKG75_03140 [Zavarzinia compransoris]
MALIWFVVLLLAGFVIVLTAGALALVIDGEPGTAVVLAVLGLLVGALLPLTVRPALTLTRHKVSIGGDGRIRMTLPTWGRNGPRPPLYDVELAPGDIAAVEHREVMRRSMGTPWTEECWRVVTHGGEAYDFGTRATRGAIHFPVETAGQAIAGLAGVTVGEAGPVEAGSDGVLRPLTAVEAEGKRRTAQNFWIGIGIAMALLAILRACMQMG